jgi:hypothetical protein
VLGRLLWQTAAAEDAGVYRGGSMRRLKPYADNLKPNYPYGASIRCPACDQRFDDTRESLFAKKAILYPCGGGHFRTVDLDGNPIWEGWCGLEKQLDLPFPELEMED